MRYWLTTHYPHPDPDTHPWHIYLKAEFKDIGEMIHPGDRVLFYESKHHRAMASGKKHRKGAEGLVVAATVDRPLERRRPELAVAEYADGTRANWLWGIPTRDLDKNGFVRRPDVCKAINYGTGSYLRGFGMRHSGVKELTEQQYTELLRLFHRKK